MKRARAFIPIYSLVSFLFSCGIPSLDRSILETINTVRFVQTQTTDYSLEFTVNGLSGTGLEVIQGSDSVLVDKDGSYTFKTRLITQSSYDVSIKTQPKSPEQVCEVVAGKGTVVRGNVNTIRINCGEEIKRTINITGTVSGLEGSGLQISNTTGSGTETLNVNSTTFAFTSISQGSSYSFAIVTQPSNPSQTCSITAPTNLSGTADRNNIALTVNCNTNAYSVQAQVTGIIGTLPGGGELQLMLNGSDTLTITSDGTFAFPNPVKSGANYTVVIVNASGLISTGKCNIPTGTGTIGGTSSTVLVNCTDGFAVEGNVAIGGGTASTVVGSGFQISLSHTGNGPAFTTQNLTIASGSTTFSFPSAIPGGSEYQISVLSQPSAPTQTCSVTTGAGPSFISANINNVEINCSLPLPVIVSPAPGTYGNDIASISLDAPISGGEIRWTKGNGSQADPTCSTGSTSTPSVDGSDGTFKFIQCRSGWTDSAILTATYTLKTDTPTFSIASGSFVNSGQSLSFSTTTTGSTWFCRIASSGTPADPACGATSNICSSGAFGSYTFTPGTTYNVKTVACKVGYSQSNVATANYNINQFTVGGTISGLTTPFGANTFVIRNNGADDLTIAANGSFTFSTSVSSGNNYAVSVFSSPENPWQTCNVTNGSGTISTSNITNVSVACTLNTYTMAGSVESSDAMVSGLSVTNGVDTINVTPGSITTPISFSTPLNSGSAYNLSITAEPTGLACSIASSMTGTVAGANITNVEVNCVNGYRHGNSIIDKNPSGMNIGTYRGDVNTRAGGSTSGFINALGTSARFGLITGIAYDGSVGYIVDQGNHSIRKLFPSNYAVQTLVGDGNPGNATGITAGPALNEPYGIATDGTFLYVSESLGNRIKRIRISNGYIENLAGDDSVLSPANGSTDGTGNAARFAAPRGLVLVGEDLFIADSGNNAIRKLNIRTKAVTTLTNNSGFFNTPTGITIVGNTLYTTNPGNTRDCITSTSKSSGTSSSYAGTCGIAGFRDGIGLNNARFNDPMGITNDTENLYISDQSNHRIRKINIRTGEVTSLAGNGTSALISDIGAAAYVASPIAIALTGEILVLSSSSFALRSMSNTQMIAYYPLNGNLKTVVGTKNLVPNGTTVYGLGRFGEANGALDNSASRIDTSNRSFTGNNTLTMAGWFRWDGSGSGSRILMYNGASGSDGSGIQLNASNSLEILRGMVGVDSLNFYIPANVWVHIAVSIFPNNNHRVYVNGKVIFEKILAGNTVSNSFLLGSNGSGSNKFPGRISEVRLYNRVLGDGEISALAQDADSTLVGSTYDSQPSQLLMNYKFWGNLIPAGPTGSTLTVTGSTVYAIGKEGLADTSFRFNGTTHLEGSSLGLPQGDHPRTACAWVFPEERPALGTLRTVFRYGNTTGNTSFSLRIMNYLGTHYIVFGGVGGGTELSFPYQLNLNNWSHLCASLDSASTARVYVNGAFVSSGSLSALNTSGSSIILIGAFNTGSERWLGKIADFRIYSKDLSLTEIRRIGVQIPVGLVADFDVNGDATDNSGFGSNGSAIGTVNYVADRYGVPSGAMRVSGGTNYISAPDTFLPPGRNPRTLCMWYKSEAALTSIPFGYGNPSTATGLTYFWLENIDYIRLWGQGADLNASMPIRNHIWRHVCGTNDGAGTATGILYVNGRIAATGTHNITISSDGTLKMGSFLASRDYTGSLDDLVVYNRVLTEAEIRALSGYHPLQVGSWNITPASSSMKLHLTAESLSNNSNGASITSWVDQSGNGADFSNVSNYPTFATSGMPFNTLTSMPSLTFNSASSQVLTRNSTITGIPSDDFSFYAVLRRDDTSNPQGLFQSEGTNGLGFQFSTGQLQVLQYPSNFFGTSLTSAFSELSQNYILASHFVRNSNYQVFSQGVSVFQSSSPNFGTAFLSQGPYSIGYSTFQGTYFSGQIAEIIYFNENLSSVDKTRVQCYLSQKYNIAVNPDITCN